MRGSGAAKGSGMAADAFERARRTVEGKRRGGGGSVPRGGRERSEEGGARVRRRMSWHGTGAAAPGCSDSGRQRTSRGRGRRARTGEAAGARDVGGSG
jgi:hypothetical protein